MRAASAPTPASAAAVAAAGTTAGTPVRTVTVATPDRRYDIVIGTGLLRLPSTWLGLPKAAQAVIVGNPTVDALHGDALQQALAPHYGRVSRVRNRSPSWLMKTCVL